jgi:hypothetical protein
MPNIVNDYFEDYWYSDNIIDCCKNNNITSSDDDILISIDNKKLNNNNNNHNNYYDKNDRNSNRNSKINRIYTKSYENTDFNKSQYKYRRDRYENTNNRIDYKKETNTNHSFPKTDYKNKNKGHVPSLSESSRISEFSKRGRKVMLDSFTKYNVN